jgi:hypothetical protein
MTAQLRASRTAARVIAALAATLVAACGTVEPTGFSGNIQTLLTDGESYVRVLPRQPSSALTDQEVIALGYLERVRLGFGSPFRIIDYILRDPDLSLATRERLSYGILALTLSGETYEVNPAVLEPTTFFGLERGARTGAAQLSLITRSVRTASSPATGERAVRLGYRIAEVERSVTGVPHSAVAQVAALVGDQLRAAADARDLLRTSGRIGGDPLGLLQKWRRELRFRVESPSLGSLSVAEEAAVARSAPRVAQALEVLALRLPSGARSAAAGEAPDPPRSYLQGDAAARLLALTSNRDYPPQAPVAVAVSIMREGLVNRDDLPDWQRQARARFAREAYNEERLVAAAGWLRSVNAYSGPRLPLIDLQVSAFLRAWAQEEPWFPGDPAPAARDLVARFGLAGIEFDPSVPERWRPYMLRTLGRAISDLQRVLPTASIRGLTVRFGPVPVERVALALHDPRTRTLFLPPESGAGTIAHEIAHDLDWQLARQRYGVRGGYATDLAVRGLRRDRIATSLRELAAAFRRPGVDTLIDSHETRPAEVFARGSDWFIAAALAHQGKTAGYLSSYQDRSLTGYGSTRGPDIGGAAVPSLLTILDVIAPVADQTRDWARAELGPTRTLSPTELATAVLYAGSERDGADRLPAIAAARDRSLSTVSSETCRFSSTEGIRQLALAQRELVLRSTAAAARGAAVEAIRELAAAELGPGDPRVESWLAWRLYGAPEPTDSALVELAPAMEDLLRRADLVTRERPAPTTNAFRPSAPVRICGGNPFAAAVAGRSGRDENSDSTGPFGPPRLVF